MPLYDQQCNHAPGPRSECVTRWLKLPIIRQMSVEPQSAAIVVQPCRHSPSTSSGLVSPPPGRCCTPHLVSASPSLPYPSASCRFSLSLRWPACYRAPGSAPAGNLWMRAANMHYVMAMQRPSTVTCGAKHTVKICHRPSTQSSLL